MAVIPAPRYVPLDAAPDADPAREYVRLLHLAATTAGAAVEASLRQLLDTGVAPTFDAARDRVHPHPAVLPAAFVGR
jgi:hypothetical protein